MLADLPPSIPLVCTIQTVETSWSHQPIAGIRELKHQQFVVRGGSDPVIEPRTVVDSRITTLVDRFSSSGVDRSDPLKATYQWTFTAPLGLLDWSDSNRGEGSSSESMVIVSGALTIHNRATFELNQQSRLTEANGTRTLNTLQESAQGRCLNQE